METIISYVNSMFQPYPATKELLDAKENIISNMVEKYEELKKEALVYGEEYYDILCVAYRESIAAHKLIEVDGEILPGTPVTFRILPKALRVIVPAQA